MLDKSVEKIRTYYFDKPNIMDIKLEQLQKFREYGYCSICDSTIEVEFSYDYTPPGIVWRCSNKECIKCGWNNYTPTLRKIPLERDIQP